MERIPLKTIHLNKCPVVVPLNTLTPEAAERWDINLEKVEINAKKLRGTQTLAQKLQQIYGGQEFPPISDPDQNLYGGGFFSNRDRSLMDDIHDMSTTDLAKTRMQFEDPRLLEMLFRYRARNWPETLSQTERSRWNEYRHDRVTNPDADCGITLAEYRTQLAKMVVRHDITERDRKILSSLADWPAQLGFT